MIEVKINGFTWFVDLVEQKIYETKYKLGGTDLKFLTTNEREQMNTWLYYGGKPMWSF